ncbi:hypothetical protein ISN44_As11g032850 [Arabidopsis suecica]|uniref:Uncharacterized protein n=1 Tax=Arabidopsis suecica TaxID=45249 RepID=A0A8T1ZGP9_ARASU|nr:hypothetical protein ISN44_As11g032850 [Arabidopsis suecica]
MGKSPHRAHTIARSYQPPSSSSSTSSTTPHRFKSATTPASIVAAVSGISFADVFLIGISLQVKLSHHISLLSLLSGDSHSEDSQVTLISSRANSGRAAVSFFLLAFRVLDPLLRLVVLSRMYNIRRSLVLLFQKSEVQRWSLRVSLNIYSEFNL